MRVNVSQMLRELSVPLSISLVGFGAPVLLGDAVNEILRTAADDFSVTWPRLMASGLALGLLAFGLWATAHLGIRQVWSSALRSGQQNPSVAHPISLLKHSVTLALPGLLACLPVAGLAIAFSNAAESSEMIEFGNPAESMKLLSTILAGLALGAFILFFVLSKLAEKSPRIAKRSWITAALISAAALVYFLLPISNYPKFVSPISVFWSWLLCLTIIFSGLRVIGAAIGLPLASIVIVAAAAFTLTGLNRNDIPQTDPLGEDDHPLAESAFRDWLQHRPDLESYKNRPYPVFIVTAEGGGLYAAYHAALLLGRLQDTCPKFASHVFAISGVSGGALGAAIFSALVQSRQDEKQPETDCVKEPSKPGPFELQAAAILNRDLLTPLLAGTLFSDFFSMVLPFPIANLDRGRRFDSVIESLWLLPPGSNAKNPLTEQLHSLWSPEENAPALVLNTYDLSTYGALGIAPFNLNSTVVGDFYSSMNELCFDDSCVASPFNLPVSTAVGLSARFPIVTPEGTYSQRVYYSKPNAPPFTSKREDLIERSDVVRLVDGGYFDNTGSAGIYSLVPSLQEAGNRELCAGDPEDSDFCLAQKFEVYLLQISGAEDVRKASSFFGSLVTPFMGIASIRGAWGTVVNDLLVGEIADRWGRLPCGSPRAAFYLDTTAFRPFDPDKGFFGFPLSWSLSMPTFRMIDSLMPSPNLCVGYSAQTDHIGAGIHCGAWDVVWALESGDSRIECPRR